MDESANLIMKGLWLGDMNAAIDINFIIKNKIGAIVNCTPDVEMPFKNYGIEYYQVPVQDSLKKKDIDKMKLFIPGAIKFIHEQKDKLKKAISYQMFARTILIVGSSLILLSIVCKWHVR